METTRTIEEFLIMRSRYSSFNIANLHLLDQDSTIIVDLTDNVGTKISVGACYAPSHKDDDEYFLTVKLRKKYVS